MFHPDSWLIRFLTKVCDLLLLNIALALSCCIVVLSGAAVTALCSITLKMMRGQDYDPIKGFLRALRENFLPSSPGTKLTTARTILTIHNLRFQGVYGIPTIRCWTGLPDYVFNKDALKTGYQDANMMKGGLAYVNAITTVSPTYAGEIQTPYYGEGLDAHLRYHSGKLQGIVNGIDYGIWDASADERLEVNCDLSSVLAKGSVCSNILYDEARAHRIYAGADALLVPSQFEPCGLTQLIAMHYGTVPIVRETGGLKDTVEPCNLFSGAGNGFTFDRYDAGLLLDAINRAKALYFEHRDCWDEMVRRDMEKDLSWENSAKQYKDLYLDLTR